MKKLKTGKKLYSVIGAFILCTILIAMIVCSSKSVPKVKASNLMDGVKSHQVNVKTPDDAFINSVTDFSLTLFNKTRSNNGNSLISPLSVMIALSMTANGSDHETLNQMNSVLSKDIPLEQLNQYLHTYINHLPENKKTKVTIANSIWYRDDKDLKINPNFLQTNADYYQSSIYKSPFNNQTKNDINNWVKGKTDRVIDKIIDNIGNNDVMYLINTVLFDARWDTIYEKKDIDDMTFHNQDGTTANVPGMHSGERFYIEDDMATGMMKSYYNDDYRFLALLPREGISLDDYLKQLTADQLLQAVKNALSDGVSVTIPKFKYEYDITMNDSLKELGMTDAFSMDKADFSKMGKSSQGNIYIDSILHKTYISVDAKGTKAGAVTKIEMATKSAPFEERTVILDRPFFYAIIDTKTKLPIFIGTVNNLQ